MSNRQLERDEENVEWLRDTAVEQIRSRLPEAGSLGPEFCIQCEDEIPMVRRQHGFRKCVFCAEKEERHEKSTK